MKSLASEPGLTVVVINQLLTLLRGIESNEQAWHLLLFERKKIAKKLVLTSGCSAAYNDQSIANSAQREKIDQLKKIPA